MRCIVPGCKNDSRHTSKSEGITFHVFPTEANSRTAWLKVLDKEHWEPRERSCICSKHFLAEDLYWTKSGLRKVRAGAIPIISSESPAIDFHEPSNLMVCRICLEIDSKLFSIRKCNLEEAFQQLTGLSLCDEDKLPEYLCIECVHRLINSNKFRMKSLRAYSLMLKIIKEQENLSIKSLKSINRNENQLVSNITIKHYEPDHTDLQVEYEEQLEDQTKNVEKVVTSQPPSQDVDVKNEPKNEIFLNENEDFVILEVVKNENSNKDINLDDIDDDSDVKDDYLVTSSADYSSDDSLPLENQRTLKKNKKLQKKVSPLGKQSTLKKNKSSQKKKSTTKVPRRQVKQDSSTPKIDKRRRLFLNPDLNETLFTITELTTEEQLAEIQKRQETTNFKNAIHKCMDCFKGFLDGNAYDSHMLRHTNQCGEYRCKICKTHFKHPHALRKHVTAHHMQRFSCNQCPYVTTHRQTARLHERWHKGTKYKCPHCLDEFVKFTTYMGHIRIKHPSDFVCGLCGYSFVSAKGIDLHKKLKHRLDDLNIPADGPFCSVCNVRFVSVEAHRKHLRVSVRHAPEVGAKPKESNKFKYKTQLDKRKDAEGMPIEKRVYPSQRKKAEGPIPCEQCGLQLENSRAYHGHFRRMHPDKNRTKYPSMKTPCMCEVCGKMFQSFALLRDHTWLHTGERPFKCDACDKSFRMKQRLVAHQRVHSKARTSYVCSVCGKHFSTHSNRQRHMFIHTGLKPFKCEMCGKSFKHTSEKRAHIEYVHLKKPWPKRTRPKRRQEKFTAAPAAGSVDVNMSAPLWINVDPKMTDMNSIIDNDKSIFL